LFIATSNHPDLIDEAFLDRIDLKKEIGTPSHEVTYTILARAINELLEAHLISNCSDWSLELFDNCEGFDVAHPARMLFESTKHCKLSARTLKKLPLLTLARLKSNCLSCCSVTQFIQELKSTMH